MLVRETELPGGVAELRIDNGPVGVLTQAVCEELTSALERAVKAGPRAVILTGTDRAFSAGVDLKALVSGGERHVREFFPALRRCLEAAFALPLPLVAAVNGHAIAGGCLLAMTADVAIVAGGSVRIGIPELAVGVPFPRIALEIAGYRLGEQGRHRIICDAVQYGSEDSVRNGLMDELAEPQQLMPRAIAEARRLGESTPADTFAATKTAMRADALLRARSRLEEDVDAMNLWIARCTDGWIAAYLERVGQTSQH